MNSVSFGAAPVVSTVARKAKMSRVIPSVKEKLNVEFDKLKLDNVDNYYLLNGTEKGKIYLYSEGIIESKPALSRGIKPSICIKKSAIKEGNGTLESPYTLEV